MAANNNQNEAESISDLTQAQIIDILCKIYNIQPLIDALKQQRQEEKQNENQNQNQNDNANIPAPQIDETEKNKYNPTYHDVKPGKKEPNKWRYYNHFKRVAFNNTQDSENVICKDCLDSRYAIVLLKYKQGAPTSPLLEHMRLVHGWERPKMKQKKVKNKDLKDVDFDTAKKDFAKTLISWIAKNQRPFVICEDDGLIDVITKAVDFGAQNGVSLTKDQVENEVNYNIMFF